MQLRLGSHLISGTVQDEQRTPGGQRRHSLVIDVKGETADAAFGDLLVPRDRHALNRPAPSVAPLGRQ